MNSTTPCLHKGLRPEAQLILSCVGADFSSELRDQIAGLAGSPLDWDWISNRAIKNSAAPYVNRALSHVPQPTIPQQTRANFKERSQGAILRFLLLKSELATLLREFATMRIDCMPLKGPVLAEQYYSNPGLRETGDLDLYFRPDAVPAVKEILLARGYAPVAEVPDADRHLEHDCEITLRHPETGINVEVHWEILPRIHRRSYGVNHLWRSAIEQCYEGQPIHALPPEDLLLYLCVHGGDKHGWANLKWVLDLSAVIHGTPQFNWDGLFDRARRAGRTESVDLGIYLAHHLLRLPLPDAVAVRYRHNPKLHGLAAIAVARIFREDSGLPGFAEWRAYVHGMNGSSRADAPRWAYLRSILTPDWTDRQSLSLPSALSALYYPYRIFRLMFRTRGRLPDRLR